MRITSKRQLLAMSLILFCNVFSFMHGKGAECTVHFTHKTYAVRQGRTLFLRVDSNQKDAQVAIRFLSKTYHCTPVAGKAFSYEVFIPISCECKPGKYPIFGILKNHSGNQGACRSFVTVSEVTFPRAKGLRISQVNLMKKLSQEAAVSQKKEYVKKNNARKSSNEDLFVSKELDALLAKSPRKRLWSGRFMLPTKVHWYSTKFGEIRHSNRWGKYFHKAVDIAAPHKQVVKAPELGRLIVKKRYQGSGNTMVLDHGLGVFTHYFHLDSFYPIAVGSMITKGMPIARVGNTGYSAGYHLHWELSINNVSVDPLEWVERNFA